MLYAKYISVSVVQNLAVQKNYLTFKDLRIRDDGLRFLKIHDLISTSSSIRMPIKITGNMANFPFTAKQSAFGEEC